MFGSAVIVFREVFEIVLIMGMVLAATRGIPHRGKSIVIGFTAGIAGAGLIAFLTDYISSLAEGVGQEYFNATILFVAAGFIGWTLLWMKKHSHEMKANIRHVGDAIVKGDLPYITLSVIIALSILREGSEIVLFSYGMLASGLSFASLMAGAAIGFTGGAIVGGLLYKGLISLPLKQFFQITSAILMLLVAGMVSQAFGFLTSAGAFESLSGIVWNTSAILPESGFIGQTLGVLIGYTARPSAIQIIAYLTTIGGLYLMLKLISRPSVKQTAAHAAIIIGLAAGLTLAPGTAHAVKTVTSPYVEKGEFEVESKTAYEFDEEDDVDGSWEQVFAVGYGVTDFWKTEIEGEFEHDGEDGGNTNFEKLEWENTFQLTQPGEYFVDVGAKLVYAHAIQDDGADAIEGKLLLAKDTGKFTHIANIGIEREVGDNSSDETEYSAAWSTSYRYSPMFEPGIEIYSEFGDFDNDFDEQGHSIGPVAYGKLFDNIGYDTGVLFGVSDAAPDVELKAVLEYELMF